MSSQTLTLSTGQTLQDLEGLQGLYQLANSQGSSSTSNFIPPALLDPNYVPPSRGPSFITVQTVLLACAMVFVALRIWVRLTQHLKKLFLEDWILIIALVTVIGTTIINIIAYAEWDFGRHAYDLKITSLVNIFRTAYSYHTLTLWSSTLVRVSICLFIQRLYRNIHPKMHIACTIFIVLNIAFSIAFTLAITFQCRDSKAAWDLFASVRSGCLKRDLFYSQAAIQIFADLLVLLLPIQMVLGLNIDLRRRLEVCGMLALGLLPTAAAVARFVFLFHALDPRYYADFTWELIPFAYCCQIEVNLAIMTACIPAIKSLYTATGKETFQQLSRRRNSKKGNQDDFLKSSTDDNIETGIIRSSGEIKMPLPIFTTPDYSTSDSTFSQRFSIPVCDPEPIHLTNTPRRRVTFGELGKNWPQDGSDEKSTPPPQANYEKHQLATNQNTQPYDDMTFITGMT